MLTDDLYVPTDCNWVRSSDFNLCRPIHFSSLITKPEYNREWIWSSYLSIHYFRRTCHLGKSSEFNKDLAKCKLWRINISRSVLLVQFAFWCDFNDPKQEKTFCCPLLIRTTRISDAHHAICMYINVQQNSTLLSIWSWSTFRTLWRSSHSTFCPKAMLILISYAEMPYKSSNARGRNLSVQLP